MKFYPNLTLHTHYANHLPNSKFFSGRIPDKTIKNSLDFINRAMNVCEKNDVFLDFGAGNGRYSSALLPEFKRGYGVEIERDATLSSVAKKNSNYTALFGKNAIGKIKEKVDLIILMDVIEHIPLDDIQEFTKKISSLQEKGGVIYITTPNAIRCGVVEKSGIYFKRFTYGHHKHYVVSELIDLFSPFGYEPVLIAYEDFPFRLFVKQLNIGCAYIDKKLLHIPFYRFLSLPFIFLANILFSLIGPLVDWDEYRNRQDNLSSRSILLTLKKSATTNARKQ